MPNTSIKLEMDSPVFSSSIPGTTSHTFNIPFTPHNIALLENAHSIHTLSNNRWKAYEALLEFAEVILVNGFVSLKSGINRNFGPARITSRHVLSFKNTPLNQLSYQNIEIGETPEEIAAHMMETLLDIPPTFVHLPERDYAYNHVFYPLRNINFYEFSGKEVLPDEEETYTHDGWINKWDFQQEEFHINVEEEINPITPFFFAMDIIAEILKEWKIVGDVWEDEQLQLLTLYNNYALQKLEDGKDVWTGEINPANHLSDLTVAQFFSDMGDIFNFSWVFENNIGRVKILYRNNILNDLQTIDWSPKTIQYYTIDSPANQVQYFRYSQDDEDELSANNYKDVREIEFTYSGGFEIVLFQYLFFGGTPPLGVFVKNTVENAFYVFSETIDAEGNSEQKFVHHTDIFLNTLGASYQNLELSPLFVRYHPFIEVDQTLYSIRTAHPTISNLGSSKIGGVNPFNIRLAFYHGLRKADDEDNFYPFATAAPVFEVQHYTLKWEGEYGLYERFHREWNEWLEQAEIVNRKVKLTPIDLATLQWERKVKLPTRSGQMIGLIKRIEVTINTDSIGIADIAVVKV